MAVYIENSSNKFSAPRRLWRRGQKKVGAAASPRTLTISSFSLAAIGKFT